MIEPIIADIQQAIDNETQRAKLVHGDRYASLHEAWGVLSEEEMEGRTEGEKVSHSLVELLFAIHADDRYRLLQEVRYTRNRAVNAACEYIQVAAVCAKIMDSMETGNN